MVEKDIWISCAPREAFVLHADHANRAAWHEHVLSAEMITPPPIGLGSRFHHEVMAAGRVVPMDIEIIAYTPYECYTYRSVTSMNTSESQQTFRPEDGGTRFAVRIRLQFHGLARPFGWFILKFGLEGHFEEALREIKEKLEAS